MGADMDYVTVSAYVPRELKELLDKYGVKPGSVIRKALEKEVRRRILEEAERKAKELSKELAGIFNEEIARIIRENRKIS